jgi:hypothetical protein
MTYPPVDFVKLLADVGVDFATARDGLSARYQELDRRNQRNVDKLELPCHAGCDACCHESVFVTPLEFVVAWDWAQTHLDQHWRDQVIDRALRLFADHGEAILAFDAPPPAGAADHFAGARQLRFACPMLSDAGECSIYPVRELVARLFGCSFNDAGGVYGCELVGQKLGGQVVTLVSATRVVTLISELPLTGKRQVYPYYFHLLYGSTDTP